MSSMRVRVSPNAIQAMLLLGSILAFTNPTIGVEPLEQEKEAVESLRKLATNIQFHKDGSVRFVRLSKAVVTNESLLHLKGFEKIDYLAVICPQVTDQGLEVVQHLAELDTLVLSESGVTDDGLVYIASLGKLERLYLDDVRITNEGLRHIAQLGELRVLSLARTGITGTGIDAISTLTKLETLLLAGTDLADDEWSASLSKLVALRILDFSECRLTSKALESLGLLKKLEHLDLSGAPIDDSCMESLAKLSNVKDLLLFNTGLSSTAVQQLRELLPNTRVHTELPQREPSPTPHVVSTDQANKSHLENVLTLPSVESQLADDQWKPDFQRHVIPTLGRLGCNGRSCHGSFQGQGGFRLSMFGYDFAMDHENLSERIDIDDPPESLIVNKPTSADDHEGGLRLVRGSWQQEMLTRWISAGALGVPDKSARFVRLEISPVEVVFAAKEATSQLRAVAVWSDGLREDVTALTRFETKDDAIADVTPNGLIRATGQGDTHIIATYDNGIIATPVMLPLSNKTGERYPNVPTPTAIDRNVVAKLRKLGIVPSDLCSDEVFLRRVGLDLAGTLPTPDEIRRFVADKSVDKRAKKIEELLARPAYVTWWTTRLCDLTGSNAGYLGGTEMAQTVAAQWRAWIERRVRDNVGWDEISSGMILARSRRNGQTYRAFITEQSQLTRKDDPLDIAAADRNLPHFWFRSNLVQPKEKALALGYTFMGVRLDCAECHKHPFDQWSKQDFESFTEFFTRVKSGVAPDAKAFFETTRNKLGVPVKLDTAALRRQSYMRVAAEGRSIPWREVYIEPPKNKEHLAKLLGGVEIDLAKYDDPREPLMKWLLNEPKHYLAKSFVNRIWANYFNVGIIDPTDDLNLANPPSNRALLDELVIGFIDSGYDMKWLHRTITNSRTYQLSWRPNETNRADQHNFSHAIVRRLPAEVAVDAILQATANDAKLATVAVDIKNRKIGQHPKSFQTRSIDFSLLIFGKPLRTTNCDCERQNDPTLLQALYVRNDQELIDALERNDGWLKQLTKQKTELVNKDVDGLVSQVYLRVLSRQPTPQELADCRTHLAGTAASHPDDPAEGIRDLLWALLNTQEFITNH
jgi:hypothetical protein